MRANLTTGLRALYVGEITLQRVVFLLVKDKELKKATESSSSAEPDARLSRFGEPFSVTSWSYDESETEHDHSHAHDSLRTAASRHKNHSRTGCH